MKTSGSQAFVNHLLAGLLVLIGCGGSIGLATVWMRYQISVVADSNRALQQQISDVERHIADTNTLIEEELSSDVLRQQNETMHLGLEELKQTQIVAVNEDPVYRLVARANRRVFESDRLFSAARPPIRFRIDPPAATAAGDAAPAPTGAATADPSLRLSSPDLPRISAGVTAAPPNKLQIAFRQ